MGKGDEEDPATIRERIEEEAKVTERVDEQGNTWRKVYFGGGSHFRNWLKQCEELGEVRVEEVPVTGFSCFEQTGEKLYRIWLKVGGDEQDDLFD